jgi:glycosyltransferase involved in cell wall biosynthesis
VAITVCRLVKGKNVEMTLRGFARVRDDAFLIVVGDGPERTSLEQTAWQLGVMPRVRFVGRAADPAPFYAAADVFVLPSVIEAFGLVYAEAMLMGLPCIGLHNDPPRSMTSASEVIGDGIGGFCVSNEGELAGRLTVLFDSPDLRRRMGAAGAARARQSYTCDHYVRFILRYAAEHWGLSSPKVP